MSGLVYFIAFKSSFSRRHRHSASPKHTHIDFIDLMVLRLDKHFDEQLERSQQIRKNHTLIAAAPPDSKRINIFLSIAGFRRGAHGRNDGAKSPFSHRFRSALNW